MHLVIVQTPISYLDDKRYNRQETGLAKALARHGFKVTLIYAGKTNYRHKVCDNVEIHYLKCVKLNQQVGTYFGLRKLLNQLKPDIVQIHEIGMFMSYYVLKWAKANGIKCVLIQGAYEVTRKCIFKTLELIFDRIVGSYILRNVDGVGCKTPSAEDFLFQFHNRKYFSTPVGLDESRFKKKIDGKRLRDILGIPPNKRVLLYIGVIESRRHVDTLIESLCYLPENFVLAIVGDGVEKGRLMEISRKECLADRIFWLGKKKQEELPYIYEDADLFLLASDYEIYGMVILEAMYYGLPVLSTRTGGARTLITDGQTGYIIDSLNGKDWSDRISEIFSDSVTYDKIKSKVHSHVLDNLLWSETCEAFIKLYNEAMNGNA